jgi:truncated hemoglobin YjbI
MQSMADADAVQAAVDAFSDRVLADPVLQGFLGKLDERRVRRSARRFILQTLGGPDLFLAARRDGPLPIVMDDTGYDRVVAVLDECLATAGVSDDVRGRARREAEALRAAIVGPGAG